jgi:hypothetical protein
MCPRSNALDFSATNDPNKYQFWIRYWNQIEQHVSPMLGLSFLQIRATKKIWAFQRRRNTMSGHLWNTVKFFTLIYSQIFWDPVVTPTNSLVNAIDLKQCDNQFYKAKYTLPSHMRSLEKRNFERFCFLCFRKPMIDHLFRTYRFPTMTGNVDFYVVPEGIWASQVSLWKF